MQILHCFADFFLLEVKQGNLDCKEKKSRSFADCFTYRGILQANIYGVLCHILLENFLFHGMIEFSAFWPLSICFNSLGQNFLVQ